ncbi:NUDIX domain-containing protein [Oceanobacillus sp. CFH 90083]|uniref:NUDIX domain-containing protein n=1 Tax=Oceanobacillus sp. CFH 90083 TaxID=2592336 RepID=UPI00128BBE16|nr:NUDIX domain-containing protein [Oceanobacillus sp. CFH 90083]
MTNKETIHSSIKKKEAAKLLKCDENSIKEKTLEEILADRSQYPIESDGWEYLNMIKSEVLQKQKPSTAEKILYFKEADLESIPWGFSKVNKLPFIDYGIEERSLLEYHPSQRHPIPYVIVRYEEEYFFILRGAGVGESRLAGRKGLLGGHVGEIDAVPGDIERSIENGLWRELEEEAGIKAEMVKKLEMKGIIKSNDDVDSDHLGVVYEIELNHKNIQSKEDELTGIWMTKGELKHHFDALESWSKIVVSNLVLSN